MALFRREFEGRTGGDEKYSYNSTTCFERLDVDCDEIWENERTPRSFRVFGVRLHSMGLSVREFVAVLELLGIDRSHGHFGTGGPHYQRHKAIRRRCSRRRVAVDDKQIEVGGEKKSLYAAIDTESKLLLEVDVFSRCETDPTTAFLHGITEKHDLD